MNLFILIIHFVKRQNSVSNIYCPFPIGVIISLSLQADSYSYHYGSYFHDKALQLVFVFLNCIFLYLVRSLKKAGFILRSCDSAS